MFAQAEEKRIIYDKKRNHTRPGEVLFKSDGALAQAKSGKAAQAMPKTNPLDEAKASDLHRKLMATYRYELDRQAPNRVEMATDEDMFDHIQWTVEELSQLEERGQPPLIFNLIQTTVNWVLGSQRRATVDYKILPRRKEGLDAAARKDELLRHLRDENHTNDQTALAFADAVKVGMGWLETGEGDPTDGPIVFDRHVPWRQMLWDSRGTEGLDIQKGRYVSRSKWLDLDIAISLWPGRAGILESSTESRLMRSGLSDSGDDVMDSVEDDSHITGFVTSGGQDIRRRLRVIEMWFKQPVPVQVMRGGQFQGELFDPWSEGHWWDLASGNANLVERSREVMHVALMTEKGLLEVRQSPYRHNRFPFTPIWGYRRGRDGMPYGMIRGLRDIQRDLNKRASKALHHLSTVRVHVEEGAVDDIEELRNEAGRPDAVIVHRQSRPPPVVENGADVAQAHINLMQIDAQMIQQVGGVTDENLGRKTNATSGKAITARQDQGALATSMFFDNLRYAMRLHGEKKLVNIEQFYTDRQAFRITDARGNPQYVEINDGSFSNAISLFKADFVIAEEDWRATTRQAQAEQLLDLMGKLAATAPQVVMTCLDLVIEALDVPKRDELVKRIRQMTGVADPDEDPNNPSPETQARQAEQAKQAEMAQRAAEADLGEREAKAAKLRMETARGFMGLRSDNLDQLKKAIEAAIQIAGAPAVGAAVDAMINMAREDALVTGEAAQGGGAAQPAPADTPVPEALPAPQSPAPEAQGMMQQ